MKISLTNYCIIFLFIIISTISCSSEADKNAEVEMQTDTKVIFADLTVDEALVKARRENKLVFLDFYTETCGGCTKLNKEVMHNASMAEFLNKRAISLKINGIKGKGIEVSKKYKVYGYPTVMVLEMDGSERDRISGYDNREKMVKKITDYINDVNTIPGLLKAHNNNPDDIDNNLKIARRYVDRYQRKYSIDYFKKVLELDPDDKKGYRNEAYYKVTLYNAIYDKKTQELENYLNKCNNQAQLQEGYNVLVKIYKRQKSIEKVIEMYERHIKMLPEDFYVKNEFAWDVYENRVAAKYPLAIKESKKAVAASPEDANRLDTLAWLLFESGNQKEAVETMSKAYECCKAYQKESIKKNLEIMKKGK